MQERLRELISWLKQREKTLLWSAIAAFAVGIALLCAAKYARYGYNAIDLAYFNQVFWNTVRGRFFAQSIHPHLSLGDHAELLIPLIAPIYALWQDPRMLLALQAAMLTLCAWPVWLLARDRFQERSGGAGASFVPLAFAIAWLLNPLVQNIAFFEFHVLPFAIFPLLMAALSYRRSRPREFIAWSLLALLAREDVALVVMSFSLLAWLERKPIWWRITPFALGAAWFVGAMALIRHFAPTGAYKFGVYYSWLASARPLEIVAHLFTLANLEMLLGFLMASAFLPLFSWRPLVLALAPLAQMMLGAPGGGEIVLETHYASLFLPALVLAAIDGYSALPERLMRSARVRRLFDARETRLLAPTFCALTALYAMFAFGPLPVALTRALQPLPPLAAESDAIVAAVPSDASVAASYALLPRLSSREHVYSAHYLFLGVTQFAEAPYPVPEGLQYAAFDDHDLLFYAAQFPHTAWAAPRYAGGLARLSAAAGTLVQRDGRVGLYADGRRGDSPGGPSLMTDDLAACMKAYEDGAYVTLDGDRSIVIRKNKSRPDDGSIPRSCDL